MNQLPWVKLPTDLFRLEPALRHVDPQVRASYVFLYSSARQRPPMVGALVDGELHPLRTAKLARRVRVPRTTLIDHLGTLARNGLVVRDLTGTITIPLVSEVHRRFSSNDDDGREPVDNHDPTAVDKLRLETQSVGPPTESVGPPTPRPLKASEEMDVRSVDLQEPGENPASQPFPTVPDLMAEVPADVEDSTIRYLLGKLACSSSGWSALLAGGRDRATLRRLYTSSPAALLAALQQAADDPAQIRSPGAWLTRTVPAIARAFEQAV